MNAKEFEQLCKKGKPSRALYCYHLPHKNVMGTVTPLPFPDNDRVTFIPDNVDRKFIFDCHYTSVKLLKDK